MEFDWNADWFLTGLEPTWSAENIESLFDSWTIHVWYDSFFLRCASFTFIHEPAVVLQYMLKKWESNWTSASLREMFSFAGCFAKSVLSGKKLQMCVCDFIANERAKTCFVHMFTSHKWQKAE